METARVYFQFREHLLTFTVENSLGLWKSEEDGRVYQITIDKFKEFGRQIGQAITTMLSKAPAHQPLDTVYNKSYFSNQILPKKIFRGTR